MKYMVVLEKGPGSWGAHAPDVPGCVPVGENREEALVLILEAIDFHTEGLKEQGEAVPKPSSESVLVEVDAA